MLIDSIRPVPGRRPRCSPILACLIVPTLLAGSPAPAGQAPAPEARVTLLTDEEAWKCLPPAALGGGQPLPAWARATAKALPYTTAATLELDRIYRTSEALDPKLAAAIRLAVARTLRSEYGRAYALSDLRRLGVDPDAIGRIEGDRGSLPEGERAALAFAERMTLAGDSATDAEVEGLVTAYGEAKVVAIVLQVAYANFLDRMALALGLAVEPGGPVPPVAVRYARPDKPGIPPAPRPPSPAHVEAPAAPDAADPEWAGMGYPQLQEKLEAQRGRKPRVSIPSWEEFRATLPPGIYPLSRQLRIRWSLLVSGRQPALGTAWINCLRVFEAEAAQDRVFEESLFWVVTRSLRCYYCMGHCEMLLGVAGLDPGQIADRTAKLASGDWSGFPAAERIAFAFARKLTRTPWDISEADIRRLGDAFGPERALDVIWWSSRCQFMTKVSDAFQLQLERENVFTDHLKPDEGPK